MFTVHKERQTNLFIYLFILYFNSVENHKKRHSKKNVLHYMYRINTN